MRRVLASSRRLCGVSVAIVVFAMGASGSRADLLRPTGQRTTGQGRAASVFRCLSVSAISSTVKERYSHRVSAPVENGLTCAYVVRSRQIGVTFVIAHNSGQSPQPYDLITAAYAAAQVLKGDTENPPPRPPSSASALNEPGTVAKWSHGIGFLVQGAHETRAQLKAVLALAMSFR